MNVLLSLCPQPPSWQVDWTTLQMGFPWIDNLAGCPQDPLFHAEGDVAVHTRKVLKALVRLRA
jgi:hypothetical protein